MDDHEQLIADYREAFDPPDGARDRVFAAVPELERPQKQWGRIGWMGAGATALAAAATLVLWLQSSVSSVQDERDEPSAAAYDAAESQTTQSTSTTTPRATGHERTENPSGSSPPPPLPEAPRPETVPKPMGPTISPKSARRSIEPTKSASAAPEVEAPARIPGPRAPEIAALVSVLSTVERELGADHPTRALALLTGRRDDFSSAGLSEEYDGYRVLAHCTAGHSQMAESLRVRFSKRYPRSMYSRRISTTCETPDQDPSSGSSQPNRPSAQ